VTNISHLFWDPSEAVSAGMKRPWPEADQSLPSNAEVKNGGAVHPLPHMWSWPSAQLSTWTILL
jgi:hypothetical protein